MLRCQAKWKCAQCHDHGTAGRCANQGRGAFIAIYLRARDIQSKQDPDPDPAAARDALGTLDALPLDTLRNILSFMEHDIHVPAPRIIARALNSAKPGEMVTWVFHP
jgi:hypothetical protein